MTWKNLQVQWKKLFESVSSSESHPSSGKELEDLVRSAFELSGAVALGPYSVPDAPERNSHKQLEQIDGFVFHQGLHCLVEAKHHREKVDFGPIAKMKMQLMRRPPATIGCIFSVLGFTEPAMILTRFSAPHSILLWEADDIEFGLAQEDMGKVLQLKHRYLTMYGIPFVNVEQLNEMEKDR